MASTGTTFFFMRVIWSSARAREWLALRQRKVDDIVGGDFLKFTALVWVPGFVEGMNEVDGVLVVIDESLPFLDMNMLWYVKGKLRFSVFKKTE